MPHAEDGPQTHAMPHIEQLICLAEMRRGMDSVHGFVALCDTKSCCATMSSSHTEEAADVHGDGACDNALVYDVAPSVGDPPINSLSMVVRSRCKLEETNGQNALGLPLWGSQYGRIR